MSSGRGNLTLIRDDINALPPGGVRTRFWAGGRRRKIRSTGWRRAPTWTP